MTIDYLVHRPEDAHRGPSIIHCLLLFLANDGK